MLSIQEDLARRIDTLEKELKTAIERNEQEFRYRWAKGRATFEKHALRIRSPHSRYSRFFDYGNAADYRRRLDAVRSDFVDLRTLTSSAGPAKGTPRDGK
ncbi:MAG TPA: hypothetical protein VLT57_05165 [Bryobacteraceae bacterium]|nr:hypothetical protein [Bryobacteraceae bacterium]